MTKRIYIGGIPGVGKTTTTKEIVNQFDSFVYIDSGKEKHKEAETKYGIKLSRLDQRQTSEINLAFFNQLFQKCEDKIYLIDSHYTYPVNNDFVRLFPEEYFKIDLFLLFEAGPNTIKKRRIDRRDNDPIKLSFIEREIIEERKEAERLSEKYLIPLEKICTEEPKDYVIARIIELMEKYNLYHGRKVE